MILESVKDLRQAVEKTYGGRLTDAEWADVEPKPAYSAPFDKADVADIVGRLKQRPPTKLIEKLRRKKEAWLKQNKDALVAFLTDMSKKGATQQQLQYFQATLFKGTFEEAEQHEKKKLWDPDYIGGLNIKANEKIHSAIDFFSPVLSRLGIVLPIPLDKLKETLLKLGATEEPAGLPLPYPITIPSPFPIGALDFPPIEIEMLYAPEGSVANLLATCAEELAAVTWYRYHPAEIIALWFCAIRHFPWVSNFKVFRHGNSIEIRVYWPGIKPSSIAKTYSFVRDSIIKEIRGKDAGKRAKPRGLSERTQTLLEFCKERPDLKWKEKLQEWNGIFPEWGYKDVHLMAVVYSRAKKRII